MAPAPVFVVGSPRSGTTLLYHMLLSSGGFAVYRTETHVFNMLAPRYGGLRSLRNRQALLHTWLRSEHFRRAGIDPGKFEARVLHECRSAGDFLRILMQSIASSQGVERWAECTPINILYINQIKQSFPSALFVHMVRDGRDVALSLERQGWLRPFPWHRSRGTEVAGLFWEWMVTEGMTSAPSVAPHYVQVHYEDLVRDPEETLSGLGQFLDHDLDYDRIRRESIGSVSVPNTSFGAESAGEQFSPVGRWRTMCSDEQITRVEALIGPTLSALGYELVTLGASGQRGRSARAMRALYQSAFRLKHWAKSATPLGRLTNTELLHDFHRFDQDRLRPHG